MVKKLNYLAAAYSHPDESIQRYRMWQFHTAQMLLLKHGVYCVSALDKDPTLQYGKIPGNYDFWGEYSKLVLSKCDNIIVLAEPGFVTSTGVSGPDGERINAEKLGIPEFQITLEDLRNNSELFIQEVISQLV